MANSNLQIIKSTLLATTLVVGIILQIGLIVYFFHPTFFAISSKINKGKEDITTSDVEESSYSLIKNPQYFGLDNNNQPFTITAMDANQTDKNHIVLNQVVGTAQLNPSTTISFSSDKSEMDIDSYKIKAYNAKIEVNGVTLIAEKASINTKTKSLEGEKNVKAKGDIAEIFADYCLITDNYKEIVFKSSNHVTTYITP